MKLQTRFIPFLALAILALLFAMWAGLLRLGWILPTFPNLALAHGPLMISGFLGVLIPLERAVAIRQKWMFAAPLAAGLGWVSLLFAPGFGAILMTVGSIVAFFILVVMARREPVIHTFTMAVGMLSWVLGNLLWISGFPIYQLVHWWICYLILTIGGERLELSRVLRPAPQQIRAFGILALALLAGTILSLFNANGGARLSGFAMLALSLWFLKNDLAARNIHHPIPLTRYIAYCLFAGFIWMGVGRSASINLWRDLRGSAIRRGVAHGVCRFRDVHDLRSRAYHLPRNSWRADQVLSRVLRSSRAFAFLPAPARDG
jgi:hypothetical protein